MSERHTQFDYLLNAFEQASQADEPAKEGYAEKRRALLAHVRKLEADAERLDQWQEFALPNGEKVRLTWRAVIAFRPAAPPEERDALDLIPAGSMTKSSGPVSK